MAVSTIPKTDYLASQIRSGTTWTVPISGSHLVAIGHDSASTMRGVYILLAEGAVRTVDYLIKKYEELLDKEE